MTLGNTLIMQGKPDENILYLFRYFNWKESFIDSHLQEHLHENLEIFLTSE